MPSPQVVNPGVVIVGAGQAGGRTAQALRLAGYPGTIKLIGEEAYPPYERPPLSKDILLGKVAYESLTLLPIQQWAQLHVELRTDTHVTAISPDSHCIKLAGGQSIDYGTLVLATGGRARPFLGPVAPGTQVHQLRTIDDAKRLQPQFAPGRRVALIGGGFIGLELAANARTLGAQVTLIETAERVLPRLLPTAFAHSLAEVHIARGVEIRLRCNVVSLSPHGVHLENGELIPADCVVIGIGALPNDSLARTAGLPVRDGIVVDASGRTADPNIYAVGDVARQVDRTNCIDIRLESWRNAEDQAVSVAAAICGQPLPPRQPAWFWSDQYGRNIQIVGRPTDELRLVEHGKLHSGPYLAYFLSGNVVVAAIGVDCGREINAAKRLIQAAVSVDAGALPGLRARPPVVLIS